MGLSMLGEEMGGEEKGGVLSLLLLLRGGGCPFIPFS